MVIWRYQMFGEGIMGQFWQGVIAVLLITTVVPAFGVSLPEEAENVISQESIDGMLEARLNRDYPEALKHCRKAEETAAGYDYDPFFDGLVALCFGEVESFRGNKLGACALFLREIKGYEAMGPGHKYFGPSREQLEGARKKRNNLGC